MKHFMKLGMMTLLFSSAVLANGGDLRRDQKEPPEEKSRNEISREKMMDNPRNPAMVEGFQEVDNQRESEEEKGEVEAKKVWPRGE